MDKCEERAMVSSLSMNRMARIAEILEPLEGLLFGGRLDH